MKKLEITLRRFEVADARRVSNIIRNNLTEVNCKDYPESVIKYMEELYTEKYLLRISNMRKVYVAVVDNVVVGTASIEDDTIYTVFVDVKHQGKGIGKKLMELMEEIAANKGLGSIKVPASITAQKFYESLGYKAVKEVESEEFGRSIIMEKVIL